MIKPNEKEPGNVLCSFIGKYQLNPSQLAVAVKLSQSSIRQLTLSKMKISAPIALRLAKFFGNTADFWLMLQLNYDLALASKDKRLAAALKSIKKVKKPLEKRKAAAKTAKKTTKKSTRKAAKPGTGKKTVKRKQTVSLRKSKKGKGRR